MKYAPRKRFGQNFLIDEKIIEEIMSTISPKPDEIFVEIGPGHGALTQELLSRVKQLHAIEIDKDLTKKLTRLYKNQKNFILYPTDVLTFDFLALSQQLNHHPFRLVGNLPYNISSPLLFHLFKQLPAIHDMHFTFQKEVANRLAATVGTKAFGRLTVMAQYHCHIDVLFNIPKEAFRPAPKVESSFVRLIPYTKRPYTAKNSELFSKLVTTAFSHRRKTLKNALKNWANDGIFQHLSIDASLRPESISIEKYVELANFLSA
jgi:16S rRNA (adenine1518-N6/adenine1519-N6)-dimethyltransferase